jgi:hypothetical protein
MLLLSRNDEQLVALREQIRRAGRRVHWTRTGLVAALTAPVVLLALAIVEGTVKLPFALESMQIACLFFLGALAVVFPSVAAYRYARIRRLRGAVAALSPAQRADLLAPLQRDTDDDTRRIASRLIRELGISTEVSPAAAAEGRGDEPAA